MKQIILNLSSAEAPAGTACTGKLLMIWGLYGYGLWLLWNVIGPNPLAQGAIWAGALAVGLGLLLGMREG